MNKKRKRILILITLIVLLSAAALIFLPDILAVYSEKQAIKNSIKDYYDKSSDIYLNMEMEDMSRLIDMDSIQMKNYVTALDRTINAWKWDLKISGSEDPRRKLPVYFDFKEVSVNGDTAVATVDLNGDSGEAYPPFVSFGENTFILNKKDNVWLISEHGYKYYYEGLYEHSKIELYTYDLNELIKEIEKDYDPNTVPE